jgi:hypothetical protein
MSFCELVLAQANLQTCLQMLPVAHMHNHCQPDVTLQANLESLGFPPCYECGNLHNLICCCRGQGSATWIVSTTVQE